MSNENMFFIFCEKFTWEWSIPYFWALSLNYIRNWKHWFFFLKHFQQSRKDLSCQHLIGWHFCLFFFSSFFSCSQTIFDFIILYSVFLDSTAWFFRGKRHIYFQWSQDDPQLPLSILNTVYFVEKFGFFFLQHYDPTTPISLRTIKKNVLFIHKFLHCATTGLIVYKIKIYFFFAWTDASSIHFVWLFCSVFFTLFILVIATLFSSSILVLSYVLCNKIISSEKNFGFFFVIGFIFEACMCVCGHRLGTRHWTHSPSITQMTIIYDKTQ